MNDESKETYPLTNVKVKLAGEDGNAFSILGRVFKALKKAGYDKEFIARFTSEATSSDYNHLLATVCKYVEIE